MQQSTGTDNFNFPYDNSKEATSDLNWKAALTNAFYIVNTMHDFSYRYGFTESMFNFQGGNFKKGGKENDAVLVTLFTCKHPPHSNMLQSLIFQPNIPATEAVSIL